MFVLLPGFLYGIGDLTLSLLRARRGFGESVAVSLTLWGVIGWFSFGHFREMVLLLSSVGTLWLIYVLLKERHKITTPVLLMLAAALLRYLLTSPFLYPYQKDFIMHAYSTATILHYNGYGPEYYPFGVPGFGAFNIGFHFVAAGLSYLTGLRPIDSVLLAVYTFWGVFFWAMYRWLNDPWVALLSVFTFPYPLSYLRWGGFPTLASLSLGLLAFRERPLRALPYWLGAFAFHFIPVVVPLLVYVVQHRRRVLDLLPYLLLLLLLPQYLLILRSAASMSPTETAIVDTFVLSGFPKSVAVIIVLLLLALLGYRFRPDCRIPLWGVILSVIAGVVAFLLAWYHVPFNAPKSLYMSRMVLLLLPPAGYGMFRLWRRFGFATVVLPLTASSYMAYLHYTVSLNPADWRALKGLHHGDGWFLTSYWSEGSYLPALGVPSWISHYIVSQVDEFREAARREGFRYVVCDRKDPNGPIPYYREVCGRGVDHPDVAEVVARGENVVVYRLRRVVHPDM